MMEVEGGQQTTSTPRPHGTKRPAEDSLDHAQRLSKRFNLLNLEHGTTKSSQLYIPVDNRSPAAAPTSGASTRSVGDEPMAVDDSKDKIFIRDLDEELADESAEDEPRLVFIPDIDRQLHRIPRHVLMGDVEEQDLAKQMVLYRVPHSLSVPEDKDSVRKAIIESRARARQGQMRESPARVSQDAMLHDEIAETRQDTDDMTAETDDENAMELD